MHEYTNERRGFHTKEAAENYQIINSSKPAYCSLHPCFVRRDENNNVVSADIFVADWINRANGRVHTWSYKAKCKDGLIRTFYGSYIGA